MVHQRHLLLCQTTEVLGFDTLWVPMEVFPQEPTLFFSWLQGLTSLYWFIDIFTTMNTGIYNEKGDIDARRWQIFKSYAAQLSMMKIIKMVGGTWRYGHA